MRTRPLFYFVAAVVYNKLSMTEFVHQSETPRRRGTLSKMKRHWMSVAFVLGFVVDNITLNRVDELLDNLILASYVILSMVSILLLYASVAEKLPERLAQYGRTYLPLAVQFAFGGLLSGMLIFYGRSGDWFSSWPFLVVILAAILGNEVIQDRVGRLLYNLALLFIGLFSYTVLLLPVLTGYMGQLMFVVSGLVALVVMYLFVQTLYRVIPNFMRLKTRIIVLIVGSIYIGFNFLYFLNIIPPIPLSLKELGIYHGLVQFENKDYQLSWYDAPWYQPFTDSDKRFYPSQASDVYCFASVFAPTKLHTDIYHRWQYKNEAGDWTDHGSRIKYAISGGRDGGYRGHSQIANHRPGTWRCRVETERGQVLGQEVFTVAPRSERPDRPLVTRVE